MKALFELFRRFDARRIFGYIRRLGGMSRPKVKCYDLRSTRALRVEGDGRAGFFLPKASRISIRALRVEGDPALFRLPISFPNFYPRPPGGGRHRPQRRGRLFLHFYPRPPGGGRHHRFVVGVCRFDFYPRPPGGGRRRRPRRTCSRCQDFYPRPPGGGRQRHHIFGGALRKNFYPRPPGGGRPFGRVADTCAGSNFYPRPPGGGRLACIIKDELAIAISIHALRVEGD